MSDKRKSVIALGYFDSVHAGHRAVLESAKKIANDLGANFVVFTFQDGLKSVLGDSLDTYVYNAEERQKIYHELGANEIFFAPTTKQFLCLEKEEFLDFVCKKFNPVAFVCGEDYKFGLNGQGDLNFLSQYCNENGISLLAQKTVMINGNKISTTLIKKLLAKGDVKQANSLLTRHYSVTGKVFSDRRVGSKIGFPTVNVKTETGKQQLKNGVYCGSVCVDGKNYRCIINYGARPTFNLQEKLIEAHIIDYSGLLYGKELTIFFEAFMRDIIKFDSVQALVETLEKDLQKVRNGEYD